MIGWAMRNEAKARISPATSATAVNTTALAASIGVRRGTASTLEEIMPVAYSLVITSAPSTQSGISPKPSAAARKPVGSAAYVCLVASLVVLQFAIAMPTIRVLRPTPATTRAASDQAVDRTERSFVHSERSSRAKPEDPDAGARSG